jgi:5,10-methylenetetrahydrofolate reductase
MIHIRTRDFWCEEEFETFLMQHANNIEKNTYDLRVFGDTYADPSVYEVKPWEVIRSAMKHFSKVGVVVNPTPLIRNVIEELKSFALKLEKAPDFIVTQCIYNLKATQEFFKISGVDLNKICINAGYWKKGFPYFKLGIFNPNQLTAPPQQLIDFARKECQGI